MKIDAVYDLVPSEIRPSYPYYETLTLKMVKP